MLFILCPLDTSRLQCFGQCVTSTWSDIAQHSPHHPLTANLGDLSTSDRTPSSRLPQQSGRVRDHMSHRRSRAPGGMMHANADWAFLTSRGDTVRRCSETACSSASVTAHSNRRLVTPGRDSGEVWVRLLTRDAGTPVPLTSVPLDSECPRPVRGHL